MATFLHCALVRCKLLLQRPLEALLLLLILPLTIYLVTTLLPSGLTTEGIPVALVDQDQSEYSQLVIERLSKQPLIQAQLITEQEARKLIQQGKLDGAFILKEGFMERLKQGERQQVVEILQAPSSLSIGILRELVGSEVIRLASNVQAANFVQEQYLKKQLISTEKAAALWQQAWEHSDSYWEPEPLMTIRYKEFFQFSPKNKETLNPGQSAPDALQEEVAEEEKMAEESGGGALLEREQLILVMGWLAALIMLLAIFLQHWLVAEKEQGILVRVKGYSTKPILYLLGHSLPILLLLIMELVLSLWIIEWQLGTGLTIKLTTNWLLLSLLFVYTLFCFSLAFCLAFWVRTSAQFQGMGLSIVLLTSIFGGAFVPLTEWTSIFQFLALFTPQDWLLSGVRASLSQVPATAQVWQSVAILCILALICCYISFRRWRKT